MQSKKIVLSALFLALPLSAAANDVMGVYVTGKVGSSAQQQSKAENSLLKSGMTAVGAGGVAVGYDFNPEYQMPFRAELEYYARASGSGVETKYTYGSQNASVSRKINTQTVMANGYWDIYTNIEGLRPFLSAGLGMASNKMKLAAKVNGTSTEDSDSSDKTQFAWALGVGVGYDFNSNWALELGYRYLDAGKASLKNKATKQEYYTTKVAYHDVNLGLRYTF